MINKIYPLGKKQNISNEDWLWVFNNIEDVISQEEIEKVSEDTINKIEKDTRDKRACISHSGGKDSAVIYDLSIKAGVDETLFCRSNLEYPGYCEWVESRGYKNLTIFNNGWDMEWLKEHQDWIFPQDAKTAGKWFKGIQHTGQNKHFLENQLDMLVMGRRKLDGNYPGPDGNGTYRTSAGVYRYTPIYFWTHEQVLGYIHYNKIELPPIYQSYNFFKVGTGAWPARQNCDGIKGGWDEIYKYYSKELVKESADIGITTAQEYLAEIEAE